jgi:hypothetical protein
MFHFSNAKEGVRYYLEQLPRLTLGIQAEASVFMVAEVPGVVYRGAMKTDMLGLVP